jgi:hypothetical protein
LCIILLRKTNRDTKQKSPLLGSPIGQRHVLLVSFIGHGLPIDPLRASVPRTDPTGHILPSRIYPRIRWRFERRVTVEKNSPKLQNQALAAIRRPENRENRIQLVKSG